MAKKVIAYESRCRYCKKTRLSIDEGSMDEWLTQHEDLCRHNPMHRDCESCIYAKWITYCMWCTLHKSESLNAKIKHMDTEYMCTTWECKKNLKRFIDGGQS